MKQAVFIVAILFVGLICGLSAQTTLPSATLPTTFNTDMSSGLLSLIGSATSGNTCNAQAHVWCVPNTNATALLNGAALKTAIGAHGDASGASPIGNIEHGASVYGEVVVVYAFDGVTGHSYDFTGSGGAPFSQVGGGSCIANNINSYNDGPCNWYIGEIVQPNPANVTPLVIVTTHYPAFVAIGGSNDPTGQHTRVIPVTTTDGGFASPKGQTANVSANDFAQFNSAGNTSNQNPFIYLGQNNTNGVRFIGIELTTNSTFKAIANYQAGVTQQLFRALGNGVTATRALFIKDGSVNLIMNRALRIDEGFPTISARHVDVVTPCGLNYMPFVQPATTQYLCLEALNTHFIQGQSYLTITYAGIDYPVSDVAVNSMAQGSGSGQCAAGAVGSGNGIRGNICVVDSTHAYASITATLTSPANGGVHAISVDTPPQYPVTAAASASGGNTVYSVTIPATANILPTQGFTIAGFTAHTANNGTFGVVSQGSGTITLNNPSGVAETHAATMSAGGSYASGTEHTATDLGFQVVNPQAFTVTCTDCPITGGSQPFLPSDAHVHTLVSQGTVSGANATLWTLTHALTLGAQAGTVLKPCTGTNTPITGCALPVVTTSTQTITQKYYIPNNAPGTNLSAIMTNCSAPCPALGSQTPTGEIDVNYYGLTTYQDNAGTNTEALDYCGPSRWNIQYGVRGNTYNLVCHGVGSHWTSALNCTGSGCTAANVNLASDITINSMTVNSATQLTINVTVGANAESGAQNIVLDRIWAHGSDGTLYSYSSTPSNLLPCNQNGTMVFNDCYTVGAYDVTAGILLDGPNNAIINSYVNAIHDSTFDSQGVGIAQGCGGPTKIINNFVSASTENIFTGGGTGWNINVGMCAAGNVEVADNYVYTPPSWRNGGMTIPNSTSGSGNCGVVLTSPTGSHNNCNWTIKDSIESKGVNTWWVHDNVVENHWAGTVSAYSTFVIGPRGVNDQGLPASNINDVTFQNNIAFGTHDCIQIFDYDVNSGYTVSPTTVDDATYDQGTMDALQSKRKVFINNLCLVNSTATTTVNHVPNLAIQQNAPIYDTLFQNNTILPETGVVTNVWGNTYGGPYYPTSIPFNAPCASAGATSNNVWYLNNVVFLGPANSGTYGCGADTYSVNPTTAGSNFTARFQGNVMPAPLRGVLPATSYYGTIPSSGIPTVASLQPPTYPQLDISQPFSTDYTLTGPVPTLSPWIGTNTNTTNGVTSGVSMAAIQQFVPNVLHGLPQTTGPVITPVSLPNGAVHEAYTFTLTATGGTTPYTWSVASGSMTVCPTMTNNLCLAASTGVIAGTPSSSGAMSFTAEVTDAASLTNTQPFTLTVNAALSVSTTSIPSGTLGTAYSTTINGAGGTTPYTWSIATGSMSICPALTIGLCVNATSGSLTGTPTAPTTLSFTVQVSDPGGATATQPLSLLITPTLVITTASLPNGTQGVAYSQMLTASGGTAPYTWAITAGSMTLCPTMTDNLCLTAGTGVIAGTPSTVQTLNFTVQVTDSLGAHATAPLSISILPVSSPLSITNASFPNGTFLVPYLQALTATGGTPPYVWSISAGSLPAGLSIVNSFFSGIPIQVGVFPFTLMVTDSALPTPHQATAPFTITIQSGGNPAAIAGRVLTNW